MQTLKKFLFLLSPYERKNAGLLLILIIIMALLDMIGVASILPFIAVLTNPDLIETNFILSKIFQFLNLFGIENNQQFMFCLGVFVFILLVVSLAFKTFTTYVQIRFVYMLEYTIGKRLIEGYLHQPYSSFLSRNSSDIGKTVLSEVQKLIEIGVHPLMELISKSTVVVAIITLLFLVNPKLALISGFTLGGAYWAIFYCIKKFASQIGKMRLENNQLRYKWIGEAFGATKQVKLGGLEKFYIKRFSDYSKNYAQSITTSIIIYQLPRFILEMIAFGGVMIMILYLMIQTGTFNNALPVVSLYVFAGYRLMPALQQMYGSLTQLTFIGPSLNKVYDDVKNLKPFNLNQFNDTLSFNQKITLNNIYYKYPNSQRTTLRDINLSISAKSTIGFVGTTGSGKTTTIDIILGLLEAQKGTLEVDGKVITKKNLRAWQRSIGYVPQDIYLADDTITANIAFGVKSENINQLAVEKASIIANLHEFVMNELPLQYQTMVGERGVRLSGGQRQRIGIARALYHNPKILILDEATSALDNQTEKAVMDAINNLDKNNITTILIAHRLSSVKNCDLIFILDKGQLKDKGTFEELIKVNKQFRENAKHI